MRKLSDGAVWRRGADRHVSVEPVEREVAAKARPQLERCLKAAEFVGRALDAGRRCRIGGLVFVLNRELGHARRWSVGSSS